MNSLVQNSPGETYQRHRCDVYRWAYRLLGSSHDTLDVTQDVFIKWVDQCQIRYPDNPRGWLRRVTINAALDVIRSRKRFVHDDQAASGRSVSGMMAVTETEELRRDITAALESLSDSQRQVLMAKVYDGETFAAIAGELDLAVSTVKTHYLRALKAVREGLRKKWNTER